uniref:Uncharacterized protein n=1 Tax=Cacopsylla melanoneura TaxID=428564 RepID=A0A8D8X6B4_9HEMI
MAVSKVLSIVLLGLCGAALANPTDTTTGAPTSPGSTTTAYGAPAGGVQDCLSEADKAKICEVNSASSTSTTPASTTTASSTPASGYPASTTPGLCATAGPADDFCSKLAASVSGTAPCCVAPNVCSFKVGGNATSGAGTTPAGTSTTPAGNGTTPAGNGTNPAGNGNPPAGSGPVVVPTPNTVYVSCNVTPAGFKQLKTCPSSKTIFVFPSAPVSDLLAATGSTTPGSTTAEK